MVHYGFNLGSPAANSAPERTGGRYATRHAGLNARSIGAEARQPKAGLLRAGFAGVRYRPTPPPDLPDRVFYGRSGGGVGRRRFAQRAARHKW